MHRGSKSNMRFARRRGCLRVTRFRHSIPRSARSRSSRVAFSIIPASSGVCDPKISNCEKSPFSRLAPTARCDIVGCMFDDTLTLVSWRARPRSFVALMGLYESNYIRFGWLAANLAELCGRHRSSVAADCDLVLNITERSTYTTTLNLTYLLAH